MRTVAFQSADLDELVDVWNRSLRADPISAARLENRVLLDPNFRDEFFVLARENERIIGFVLGICGEGFHFSAEADECKGNKAWILAMAVEEAQRRKGVGTELLANLEHRFKKAGKRDVWVAPYPTAYIVPGVDATAYPDGVAFLKAQGYRVAYIVLAMDASLWPVQLSESMDQKEQELAAQGVVLCAYSTRWLSAFRHFLRSHVPWDWEMLAVRNLRRIDDGTFGPEQILLAVTEGKVVGYCQYEGEHFGPFGVAEGYQGQGIGTGLLACALRNMAQQGLHNAWVLWTGDEAAKLYQRFGFRESRRFAVMRKEI
jgi:GNAT superfamily N-acetyltransferase